MPIIISFSEKVACSRSVVDNDIHVCVLDFHQRSPVQEHREQIEHNDAELVRTDAIIQQQRQVRQHAPLYYCRAIVEALISYNRTVHSIRLVGVAS